MMFKVFDDEGNFIGDLLDGDSDVKPTDDQIRQALWDYYLDPDRDAELHIVRRPDGSFKCIGIDTGYEFREAA